MTRPNAEPVTSESFTPDSIKKGLGFTLAVEFPGFPGDGTAMVGFHDEIDHLREEFGYQNVIGSLFHKDTVLSLGVFVRNSVIPADTAD
ncbi:MAG: hypothetical protein M3Q79_00680 [bacterium]|nr:hypothetical protein [bacterium]